MIIATIIASLIIIVMVAIAVITNRIEAKKDAAQGEEKQSICEGKICNDIVTFDSQEDMLRYILECYNCEWVKKMQAIYFMQRGIIIEYKSGWKVYYTYSA